MGKRIVLKPDVVPHKNLHGVSSPVPTSQLSEADKKRKQKYLHKFHKPEKKVTVNPPSVVSSTPSVTPSASSSGMYNLQTFEAKNLFNISLGCSVLSSQGWLHNC